MKRMLIAIALLLSQNLYANGWPEYTYLGECVGEESAEGRAVFKFYSADLESNKQVDGVVTLSLEYENELVDVGAYTATYNLIKEDTVMSVAIAGTEMQVPFGKNVTVTDPNGKTAVCDTEY